MPTAQTSPARRHWMALPLMLFLGGVIVAGVLIWQGITAGGNPDPTASHQSALVAALDISVLTFREGLECILVLSAVTASMTGAERSFRSPVGWGAAAAFVATLATWFAVVGIMGALTESVPALHVQAATGLVAIIVLLIVMNWFFHKVYWTGWIGLHVKKKRGLLRDAGTPGASRSRLFLGLALLGFTSLYREGFEVVLFLQSYRLRLGNAIVLDGVLLGLAFTTIVAGLTFAAHRKLPYRKMLVLTGLLLGVVLLVMVGEEAQEMQLAHWIPTTTIPVLEKMFPAWLGLWFSIFPTVQTLGAQLLSALVVIGSYAIARPGSPRPETQVAGSSPRDD